MLNSPNIFSLSLTFHNSFTTLIYIASMCLMCVFLFEYFYCIFEFFSSLCGFFLFVEPFKCTSFPLNVLQNWKADLNFNHANVIDNSDTACPNKPPHTSSVCIETKCGFGLWINSILLFECTISRVAGPKHLLNIEQWAKKWQKWVCLAVAAWPPSSPSIFTANGLVMFIKSASVMYIFIKL